MERMNSDEEEEEEAIMFFSQDNIEEELDYHFKRPLQDLPLSLHPYLQLQQHQQRMVRNIDLEVLEILRERREAIQSGRLKKKRLFEAFEDAVQMDMNCGCSSVLSQSDEEVRRLCCPSSTSDHQASNDNDDDQFCGGGKCYYSASTSSLPLEVSDQEEEEMVVGGDQEYNKARDDEGQWRAKLIAWVVAVVIAIFAMVVTINILGTFGRFRDEDHDQSFIPT